MLILSDCAQQIRVLPHLTDCLAHCALILGMRHRRGNARCNSRHTKSRLEEIPQGGFILLVKASKKGYFFFLSPFFEAALAA